MPTTNSGRKPISEAEIFTGLDAPEMTAFAAAALLRQYVAGERIFSLGDEARTLLVIGLGIVGLTIPVPIKGYVDDVILEEKLPGSVIAWSALVPPHRFTLGAKAKTDVELHCFDRDTLAALFEKYPRIHLVVTGNLNRVIASRVTLLEALVARDVQRWVAEKYA
jgi:CRP/FNR family cyclic AMP-dependent transcriptional regulator